VAHFGARTSVEPQETIVALHGECDLSVSDELTSVLLAAVRSAEIVTVDMSELTFLDSSGLHALVTAHHAARDCGRHMYVVAPSGMVATVLDITGVGALLSPPADADSSPPVAKRSGDDAFHG
jgi:anti-sigma B factor antagonist